MNDQTIINIRDTGFNDEKSWNNYLKQNTQGNFYQRYEWKNIIESNFGHECNFMIAEQDHNVVGLFPMVYIKSNIFGKIISSMPFVNFGGLIGDSQDIVDLLLQEAETLAVKHCADYVEIRSLDSVSEQLPTSLKKISMTLDLDPDPDTLWNNFQSKHRTNIRRVYKENVHVEYGCLDLLDTFYHLMSQSWKGLGTPIYRKSYFESILKTFPEETLIFVAYQDNIPVATAFNGYYKGTVEGMWAGALPSSRKTQPNYVLYWEMIKHACESGHKHFHLGRSSADSGAEAFKKKWKAYSKQLYWQYILNNQETMPELNVNNPKYNLAIKAWRKLPLKLTTIIGPMLARSIP